MAPLTITVDGCDYTLADDILHYLLRDGESLTLSRAPDEDPGRQLGWITAVLDTWIFHVANVPAARVLRIDGEPVTNVRQPLRAARPTIDLLTDVPTGPARRRETAQDDEPPPPREPEPSRRELRNARRYVIGRVGTNADIQINDPLVRAQHATVRIDGKGRWWIVGEIHVDGVRQMSATLVEGDVFVVGQTVVTVSPDLLPGAARTVQAPVARTVGVAAGRASTDSTGLEVRLDGVTVFGEAGRKRLDNVSLAIAPGEVVAVVGPSGAGKSSLIKVLMGELAEQEGTVRLGPVNTGRTDPALRRLQVRYVPQGDSDLYPTLTVRETLTFAARLRATPDNTDREIADRVNGVIGRLGLDQPATLPDHPVEKLSGGQRRRVAIGMELVGDPKLLLLDEPTSGLDPGKDRAIMADLRDVSSTYHCTVVIVTHATEHLYHVDKVVVIGRGGRVRDAGRPDAVLATLQHRSWADLMVELDQEPPPPVRRVTPPPTAGSSRFVPPVRLVVTGYATLLKRQLLLTRRRGRTSLGALFLLPAVCTYLAAMASPQGLTPGVDMGPVLAILITVAALTGASLTYLDLVNDSEVLRRDWRVGIEVLPIVAAKATVFSGVCAILAAVVTAEFTVLRDLPPAVYGMPPVLMLYATCFLTMLASTGAGLLISAFSPSLERAVTWSTLLAVLQVALNGTLFRLPGVLSQVTTLLPARPGLAVMAAYADLNGHRGPALYDDWLWEPGAGRVLMLSGLLVALFVCSVTGSIHLLHRRWTR